MNPPLNSASKSPNILTPDSNLPHSAPSSELSVTENTISAGEANVNSTASSSSQPTVTAPSSPAAQVTPAVVASDEVHTGAPTARKIHSEKVALLDAGDDDLIEKTWVDQAEKIIDENNQDPKNEDDQQHDMSRIYLKKRFNLDVT